MKTQSDLPSNRRVLYLSHPSQLFIKLNWDLGLFQKTLSGENHEARPYEVAAFHAFNVAVTAWHLTDWIWGFLDEKERVQMVADFEFESQVLGLRDFQRAVRKKSRALEICWEVANGSKHFTTHEDSKVETQVDVKVNSATVGEFRAGQPLQTFSYEFIINWNGQVLEAVKVFEEARDFWGRLLNTAGLVGEVLMESEITVTITRASANHR